MERKTRNSILKMMVWVVPVVIGLLSPQSLVGEESGEIASQEDSTQNNAVFVVTENAVVQKDQPDQTHQLELAATEGATKEIAECYYEDLRCYEAERYYEEVQCQAACECEDECERDPCCEYCDMVDYAPWEEGGDSGLYCLPGSRCGFSCPTCPSGAEIYKDLSIFNHTAQYPVDHTPEEWKTIMLHMRVLLPMTACDYRKVLSFMQNRPFGPKKKRSIAKAILTRGKKDETETVEAAVETADGQEIAAVEAVEENGSLEEMIGEIDTSDVALLDAPAGETYGILAKFNHVFTGYLLFDYQAPTASFFGDLDGTNSFSYIFVPVFLTRYGDNILMAAKVAAFNFGQQTQFLLPYAYLAYVYNDYLTVIAGKFIIPYGVYFNRYVGWVEKSATNPLCRSIFETFSIAPNVDIGLEVKGAIPLCCLGRCFERASLSYDGWIGNGPSERNDFSPEPPLISVGSISYDAGQGNSPNNNNQFTFGGRIGFMPNDCADVGFSFMKGRWNSIGIAFGEDPGQNLYFQGAAFDWNVNFWKYFTFRGEYLWTQYENSSATIIPFGGFPPPIDYSPYPTVTSSAYWAQLSCWMTVLSCICPDLYCCSPCFWDSLELVLRSGAVWRDRSGKQITFFDNSELDMRRVSITIGYYFTQTFTAKFGYDINYGGITQNFFRDAFTSTQDPVGFGNNVFTFKIAYGW